MLIELYGRDARLTESQFMAGLVNAKRPGQRVGVVVLRDGQRVRLDLPMQQATTGAALLQLAALVS